MLGEGSVQCGIEAEVVLVVEEELGVRYYCVDSRPVLSPDVFRSLGSHVCITVVGKWEVVDSELHAILRPVDRIKNLRELGVGILAGRAEEIVEDGDFVNSVIGGAEREAVWLVWDALSDSADDYGCEEENDFHFVRDYIFMGIQPLKP